jgi:hypothetical protein
LARSPLRRVSEEAELLDTPPEVSQDGGVVVVAGALASEKEQVGARRMVAERDLAQDAEGGGSALLEEASEEDVPCGASFSLALLGRGSLAWHEGEATTRGGSARRSVDLAEGRAVVVAQEQQGEAGGLRRGAADGGVVEAPAASAVGPPSAEEQAPGGGA